MVEHNVTVSQSNPSTPYESGQISIPAEVVRNSGMELDDDIEVTINEIGGLITSVTFEGHVIAGDDVTVPAELVRRTGIELEEEYPVEFELLPDDELDGSVSEAEDESEDDTTSLADLFG